MSSHIGTYPTGGERAEGLRVTGEVVGVSSGTPGVGEEVSSSMVGKGVALLVVVGLGVATTMGVVVGDDVAGAGATVGESGLPSSH